jgi:membrane-associated phospholipid phosphatase
MKTKTINSSPPPTTTTITSPDNDHMLLKPNTHHTELNSADRLASVNHSLIAKIIGPKNLQTQVDIAYSLQNSPYIPRFFAAQISLVGSGTVVLLVLCAVFWRLQPNLGWLPTTGAALVVCASGIVKAVFKGPRPYWLPNHKLQTLDPTLEVSYGFPSGHTSAIGGVYALIADRWRHETDEDRSRALFGVMILVGIIAASRVYTAAHFIHDVVGGAITGGIVFLVASAFEDNLTTNIEKASWLMGMSFFTFGVVMAQFPSNRRIPFKLVQESMSGVGFCWGLALSHVLEANFYESRTSTIGTVKDGPVVVGVVADKVPLWACVIGILGILCIHGVNKSIYHAGHDLSRWTLIICCSLYGCIILYALYALPLVMKMYGLLEK